MEEKTLCEIYENLLMEYYHKGLCEQDWKNLDETMQVINQKYNSEFCSRELGIAFYHITRLQEGKASPAWQGSEMQRYCQQKLQGVA